MMDEKQFATLIHTLDAPRWTDILSSVVVAVSLLFAVASVFYARRQIIGDNRRSQRQVTVDLCIKWTEFIAPETLSVTRLVERLNPQQVASIANLGKLTIEKEFEEQLINILEMRFPEIRDYLAKSKVGEFYVLEGQVLQHLRNIAVRYLNMLESILLAWASNIADREAIVRQFSYILNEKEYRTAMEEFRRKIGTGAFPCIALFVKMLRERQEAENNKVERQIIA